VLVKDCFFQVIVGDFFSETKAFIILQTSQFSGKWIELEDIMLSDVSQTLKDKYFMFSFMCGG
jgi:hypothetical protein